MKDAIVSWLVARFAEKSSAIGVGAMITSAWGLYAAVGAHDRKGVIEASIGLLFGLVAFVTRDGHVLDYLGAAQGAARGGKP